MNRIARFTLAVALCAATLMPAAAADPPAPARAQRTFASPEAAASALCEAARTHDIRALRAILGRGSAAVIESGDAAEDIAARTRFASSCGARTRIENLAAGRAEVSIGLEDWHIPFPLVERGSRWRFDTGTGLKEILARRIGRNELAAIQALLAYVEAQREYALAPHDGVAAGAYAQRIASTAGSHDGLYWEPSREAALSPLGVLFMLADADAVQPGLAQPYHGYHFRVLRAQGASASGGALDYVLNGRMIGGFALVAWPARYRADGVRTFIVSHDGAIFSRDLGTDTARVARAMHAFDPDAAWRRESAQAAAPTPDARPVMSLAAERGCTVCHGAADAPAQVPQILPPAPAFRAIAARYRSRPDAEEALTRIVMKGSGGTRHWHGHAAFDGMLPNESETSPDEARSLVRWILTLSR